MLRDKNGSEIKVGDKVKATHVHLIYGRRWIIGFVKKVVLDSQQIFAIAIEESSHKGLKELPLLPGTGWVVELISKPQKCTCDIMILMALGCICGGE